MLGLDLGADGYITKPFDPIEVLATFARSQTLQRIVRKRPKQHFTRRFGRAHGRHRIRQRVLDRSEEQQRGFLYGLGIEDIQQTVLLARRVYTKAQLYELISASCMAEARTASWFTYPTSALR